MDRWTDERTERRTGRRTSIHFRISAWKMETYISLEFLKKVFADLFKWLDDLLFQKRSPIYFKSTLTTLIDALAAGNCFVVNALAAKGTPCQKCTCTSVSFVLFGVCALCHCFWKTVNSRYDGLWLINLYSTIFLTLPAMTIIQKLCKFIFVQLSPS